MIYLKIFISFCFIGTFAFGGGYAVLPLIQEQCVEKYHWLTMSEFSDLLTLSQITPGPIAINAATFVGVKVAGIPGALIASFALMLPPFLIVSLLYIVYRKYGQLRLIQNTLSGLKPGAVGLIAAAGLGIIVETVWRGTVALASTDCFLAALTFAAFIILRKWKPSIIITILSCGVIGLIWELLNAIDL